MQLLVHALIAGSLAALMAGGLALVYGVLGVFNLALGQLALIGGYLTWWLYQVIGMPFIFSVIGGLLLSGMITWITFEIVINPFYKRHRFLPLVTTIAASMIFDALILLFFEERPRSILQNMKHFLEFGGMRISIEQFTLIILTLLFLGTVAYILHSTSFGRKIRATVQHSEAAMSLGIPANILHHIIFIMSGILAGCGGIFIGIDQNLTPVLGFPITIKAYAALIAGGKDNFWGTILCAYLIALIEQLSIGIPWFAGSYIPAGYQSVVALLFIIIVLLVKPNGLFSHKVRTA